MKHRRLMFILGWGLLILTAWAQESPRTLTLRECIRIALENNPTVRRFENLKRIADHNVKSSYSTILPTVSTSASASRFRAGDATTQADVPITVLDTVTGQPRIIGFRNQEVTNPGFQRNNFSAGLSIDQTIFDGGNWWNTIRQSKAERDAALYDLFVQVNQVIKEVAQAYLDLLKQERLLEVYRLAVQRSEDNLERSQKMYDLGSVAKVDVFRARVNLGNDRIAYLNQKNVVQQSRRTLNITLGFEPDAPIQIDTSLQIVHRLPSLDEMVNIAYQHQPELRRREKDIRAKELGVSLAKSSFFPRISAFFSYSRNNTQLEKIYTDINKNWNVSIGVRASLNLFNGFQDQVRVQNSKINVRNAQIDLENYKRTLRSEIARLYERYQSLVEIIEIRRDNLEAAREEFRLATERYRLGAGTSLDVREAQINLTDAERLLVDAEYDLIMTYAELQEAIGNIREAFLGE